MNGIKDVALVKDAKRLVYLAAALGMLLYAVPRLDISGGWTAQTVFSVVWIGFALLLVAAQLHFILGVDEEMKDELKRIRQVRRGEMMRVWGGPNIHPGRK